MIPIEEIAEAFNRTYRNVIKHGGKIPSVLKDVQYLARIIKLGEERRLQNSDRLGIPVPRFCIFSVTWDCNLECIGCYASRYSSKGTLTVEDIKRIASEASDLGSFAFIIAGGEPFLVPDLVQILSSIKKSLFFVFTNGTRIDEQSIKLLNRSKNIVPVVSIEGESDFTDYRRGSGVSEQVLATMKKMTDQNIGFGFSSMATHANVKFVTSRDWFDQMWTYGARFGFIIDYIPQDADSDLSLTLTDEDMEYKKKELEARNMEARPAVVNFPPDEYNGQSCQSAGRGLIHINADGFVEPCPFSHYARDNVKDKSLIEILASEFFTDIRDRFEHEPFKKSCMLTEHKEVMDYLAGKHQAFKTDMISIPTCTDGKCL